MANIFAVQDGRKAFGQVRAVDGVSFTVRQGTITLIEIYRSGIPVPRGDAHPDLRVLREQVLRRVSVRHVATAAHSIVVKGTRMERYVHYARGEVASRRSEMLLAMNVDSVLVPE